MAKAGYVEKVYIFGSETFRKDDLVKAKFFQRESVDGRIAYIDYGKIKIDISKEFKAREREIDLNSDNFIGLERIEEQKESESD